MKIRILAKPKYGTSNLINDRLYREIEKNANVDVIAWTPLRMLLCRYDVLHVHWPENVLNDRILSRSVVKVLFLMLAIGWIKLLGRRLVWTAHNAVSHDGHHPKLEALFWQFFIPRLDGIIALSEESLNQVRSLRSVTRKTSMVVVPHGSYCGVYPDVITRPEARVKLNLPLNANVLLNLGLIRRYKEAGRLIELARENPNLHVLIAGKAPEEDYQNELYAQAEGLSNVHLQFKFIADEELQIYLRAADLFALPYDKITNSGSAILALSYDLPVLAPKLPCFESLTANFGDSWVSTYAGVLTSEMVEGALEQQRSKQSTACVEWGDWAWPEIANKVIRFYGSIMEA
jgi:glycosyltransferase involved in cell wall biosynthesis